MTEAPGDTLPDARVLLCVNYCGHGDEAYVLIALMMIKHLIYQIWNLTFPIVRSWRYLGCYSN